MDDLTRAEALAELRSHECDDPIQREAIERTCDIVARSEFVQRLEGLDLVVVDPIRASHALQKSKYYTLSCKSLFHESVIIVNLHFLAEMEGAIRTFATSGSFFGMPQLSSDQALFDLVRKFRPLTPTGIRHQTSSEPWPHLKRLRRLTSGYGAPTREGDREVDIRQELLLVILFFVAHEIGHLLDGKDARNFGTFLLPKSDLEHRVANAVVKLARHVEDFKRREHELPGFEEMTNRESDVWASVKTMEMLLGDAPAKHEAWFIDESSADQWASRFIDEYIARINSEDRHEAAKSTYLFCRGVFGVALYSWYADLLSFFDAIGIEGLTNSRSLMFAMMEDRNNYIHAASLFGEIHRNTLLRGEIALEAVLEDQTDWFDHCEWTRSKLDTSGPEEKGLKALEKWWLEENVLRFCLLGIIVDTAVKLAYVGAASSFIKQSREGGWPILMMNFEPIETAVSHLSKKSS